MALASFVLELNQVLDTLKIVKSLKRVFQKEGKKNKDQDEKEEFGQK